MHESVFVLHVHHAPLFACACISVAWPALADGPRSHCGFASPYLLAALRANWWLDIVSIVVEHARAVLLR